MLTGPLACKKETVMLFLEMRKAEEEFLDVLLYYSGVAGPAIAEKVEQLGFDFRKMHDQTFDGAVNVTVKTKGVAALLQANNLKAARTVVYLTCSSQRCAK